jgi:hypothetical protein
VVEAVQQFLEPAAVTQLDGFFQRFPGLVNRIRSHPNTSKTESPMSLSITVRT